MITQEAVIDIAREAIYTMINKIIFYLDELLRIIGI